MKIALGTIELGDHERRAIWFHFNSVSFNDDIKKCPKATRSECRQFIVDEGLGSLELVDFRYTEACGYEI